MELNYSKDEFIEELGNYKSSFELKSDDFSFKDDLISLKELLDKGIDLNYIDGFMGIVDNLVFNNNGKVIVKNSILVWHIEYCLKSIEDYS